MKKTYMQEVVEGGIKFGKGIKPEHFMNPQHYAHAHVQFVTRDYLLDGSDEPEVTGFGILAYNLMTITVAVGRVYDLAGVEYESIPDAPAVVPIIASDPALPRIDLVYALLEKDADAEVNFQKFVRTRTDAEYAAGRDPYNPTEFNVPNELHTRATVLVRKGVAAANPASPVAGANEVPLYKVRVEAGAVAITADKVTDVRILLRSLHNAWLAVDALIANPIITNFSEQVDDRVAAFIADSTYLTRVYNDAGNILTLDADIAAFDARYVNLDGDTMSGHLTLPSNGLAVGTTELVVAGGKVVIGGASASGANKKGHVNGGLSIGSSYSATDTPANGLAVQGDMVIGGKLANYNGQATAGIGQPIIKAQVNLNGSAAIPLTTLFTGAPDQAVYRVSAHIVLFGQGSAGTIAVNFKYADERVTRTMEVTSMSASVLYSHGEGTIIARAAPSPIQYEVVYTGVTGDPTWFLHIIVEQISQ